MFAMDGTIPLARLILSALLLVWFAVVPGVRTAIAADAPANCEICHEAFTDQIYLIEDQIRQVKKHICLKCSKSKVVCSICGLAANPKTLRKLDDGRILCELDVKGAMLDEKEAREVFQEVKRDVQRMLARHGKVPDQSVTAYLVNRDDFIKEYQRKPGIDEPERLLGLTHTQAQGGSNFVHLIYLLSGTPKPQFMATCAHEYVHTWLNEHASKARTLNKDTVEGICEWIAWKYVTAKNDQPEVQRILDNSYTRGQIHALIAAEERYQFYRVIDWIRRGADSWLDIDNLDRMLLLKEDTSDEPPGVPLWQQTTVRTTVPDTLVLRGISNSGKNRFALINDRTLATGESAKVRIGSSNVMVHCIEIRDASVLLQVGEAKARLELSLPAGKTKN